jgi:hypothetical protein
VTTVLVIGANSVIGEALAKGISTRLNLTKAINVVRTSKQTTEPSSEIIQLESYSEIDIENILTNHEIAAIVISFGVLDSSESLSKSLDLNIGVNTFEYLKVLEKIIESPKLNPKTEIHITSSLLADFSRNSVFIYSLSKQVTEKIISQRIKPVYNNLFIWKLSFVHSPLNSNRLQSFVKTSPQLIEEFSEKYSKPGTYYMPRYSRYPSLLLKSFPAIQRFIR